MSNINIEDKIKKLTIRKEIYDKLKETTDYNSRVTLHNEARKLADDIYTLTFVDYLKSKPVGHVIWSNDEIKAITAINQNSKYERIVKFIKNRKESAEKHVYFGRKEIELLKELDKDALKLFADLHKRKTRAKNEFKQLEQALKLANSAMLLYHFDNSDITEIVLDDKTVITKDYYMGHAYIKVD